MATHRADPTTDRDARAEEHRLYHELKHLHFFLMGFHERQRLRNDVPDHAYPARSGPDPDALPRAPGYATTAPWTRAAERRADTDARLTRNAEQGDPYAAYPDSHWHGWQRAMHEVCTPVQAHCITHHLVYSEKSRDVADALGWHDPSRVTSNVNRGLRLMVLRLREMRRKRERAGQTPPS